MLRFDEKQLSRLNGANAGAQDTLSFSSNASDTEEDLPADFNLEEAEDIDEPIEDSDSKSEIRNQRDWRRVRKIYERSKQYIFVAATLPLNGKRTAGGILKQMFPDANWVSGNYLHHHNPRFFQFTYSFPLVYAISCFFINSVLLALRTLQLGYNFDK